MHGVVARMLLSLLRTALLTADSKHDLESPTLGTVPSPDHRWCLVCRLCAGSTDRQGTLCAGQH